MAGGGDPKWQKDAADQNFDYMFKLLIIGNSSVGKTSFLFRYADDSFTSAFVSTVGIDFKVKTVFRHDKRVKLQIWVMFTFTFYLLLAAQCQRHFEAVKCSLQVTALTVEALN
jgi:Ras family